MAINAIAGAVKEGLSLWRVYLETKLERYDIHLKKRRQQALNIAEDAFDITKEVFQFVSEHCDMTEDKKREYSKLKLKFYKYNKKFNKYD